MKKFIAAVLCLICIFGFSSCNSFLFKLPGVIAPAVIDGIGKYDDYMDMSVEELMSLSDFELHDALIYRVTDKVFSKSSFKEGLDSLNEKERVYYICENYEMQVYDGGLCTFFFNSQKEELEEIFSCLEKIGALEHKKLLEDFIAENNIDINDFADINSGGTEAEFREKYDALSRAYPFDDFDNAFMELELLDSYILKYVRENIGYFG